MRQIIKKQIFIFLVLVFLSVPFAGFNTTHAQSLPPNPLTGSNVPVNVKSDETLAKIEKTKGVQVNAFSKFASKYLHDLVTSIEQNYKISNFLYYQDALVENQYFDSYLTKYVPNNTDKIMIRTLVSQFNCGRHEDVTKVLQQRSSQYLGFDPTTLSTNDPDYYQKLARTSDFLSTPAGWALYLQDVGDQALGTAKDTAKTEISSPGYAAPRDESGKIAASIDSLVASKASALAKELDVANLVPQFTDKDFASADSFISGAIDNLTDNKVLNGVLKQAANAAITAVATEVYKTAHKFIINGAQKIYAEKATCIGSPKVRPVITPEETNYTPPEDTTAPESLLVVAPTLLPPGGGKVKMEWDLTSSPDQLPGVEKATLNGESVSLKDERNDVEVDSSTVFTLVAMNGKGEVLQMYNIKVEVREQPRGATPEPESPPPVSPELPGSSSGGDTIQR